MSQMVGSNSAYNPVSEDGVIDGSIIGGVAGGAAAAGLYYGANTKNQRDRIKSMWENDYDSGSGLDGAYEKTKKSARKKAIKSGFKKPDGMMAKSAVMADSARSAAFEKGGINKIKMPAGGKARAIAGVAGAVGGGALLGMGSDALVE